MGLTLFFDIVSIAGFGLLILLVYRTQKNLLGHPARVFLTLFSGLYLTAGIANLLRHGGVSTFLARYEYIAELLFPPLFLFFIFPIFSLYIFSLFMRHDMLQRMNAEDEISASEARYRHLFEYSLEGRCLLKAGVIIAANRPMLKLFGAASIEELAAMPLTERIESEQKTDFREFLESVPLAREAVCCQEYEVVRPDGTRRQMQMMAGSMQLGDELVMQCSFHDITERKQAERKLHDAQAFLQSVIDGVADSIMVIDRNHQVLLMNEAVSRAHAVPRDSVLPWKCYAVSHHRDQPCQGSEHPCPLTSVLADASPKTFLHRHLRHDGSDLMVEIVASPVLDQQGEVTGIIEVGRDVTVKLRLEEEKKRLEGRIVHQQREQAIAVLARGMAHDFNNLLASMQASLELLAMDDSSEENRSIIAVMEQSTGRMVELTNQLLAYAREGKYQDRELAVDVLVNEALDAAGVARKAHIKTELRIDAGLWPIQADPSQIRQLLANVIVNAVEEMERDGGSLAIEVCNRPDKDEWECPRRQVHPAGDYIQISIRDTGAGIRPDMAESIFDPFVSSKGLGRGLGLAAATGIVHNHGGCMTVQSVSGRGAAFHIFLPRFTAAEESAAAA